MANLKAPSILTNLASKNKDPKDGDNSPVAVPSTIDTLLFLSHSQDREGFPIQFAIDDFNFIEEIAQSKNSTVWLVNYRFANNLLVLKVRTRIRAEGFGYFLDVKFEWVEAERQCATCPKIRERVYMPNSWGTVCSRKNYDNNRLFVLSATAFSYGRIIRTQHC